MNLPPNIFIFEDDKSYRQLLKDVFSEAGYQVASTDNSAEIFKFLREEKYFLVVFSVTKVSNEHLSIVKSIKQNYPFCEVCFIVKWPNLNSAYNASLSGAKEFLSRTPNISDYIQMADSIYKNVQKKYKNMPNLPWTTNSADSAFLPLIITENPKMKQLLQTIDKVAYSDSPVIITGETGVGKELIAQTIHKKSLRKNNPFCALNCGAIPENLLENELFGHERGAFTGAVNFCPGLLAQADTGTIFLDEVTELTPALQVKLLRVIEEGRFRRLGGKEEIRVNIRIISATNRNIYVEVQNNKFRADLYYRLAVILLTIPPLRERKDDIPLLVQHFLKIANKHDMSGGKSISDSAMKMLMEYHWPGNIRELRNCIERLVILCHHKTIERSDVLQSFQEFVTPANFIKELNKPDQFTQANSNLSSLKEVEKNT